MKAMTMPDLFKRLDVLPRHPYPFLWADYVELLCLCSKNGLVSRGNLQAQVQEAQDVQVDADIDGDGDEIAGPNDESTVLDDKVSAHWDDIVSRLNAREASYPGWPFQLEGAVLRSVYDERRADHRLYVALLIASSLRLCVATRSNEVTSAFEEISYQWLSRSLPQFWKVRPFGAHAALPDAYVGNLREKFELLAADINAKLQMDADEYDPANTGDGGLDLVAWQEVGDQRGSISSWMSPPLRLKPISHLNTPAQRIASFPTIYPEATGSGNGRFTANAWSLWIGYGFSTFSMHLMPVVP